MSEAICGAQHPKQTFIVCTKPAGHDGRHGKPEIPYRSIFWNWKLAAAKGG